MSFLGFKELFFALQSTQRRSLDRANEWVLHKLFEKAAPFLVPILQFLGIAARGFSFAKKSRAPLTPENDISLLKTRAGNMLSGHSTSKLRVARSQDALQMFSPATLTRSSRPYLRTARSAPVARKYSYLTPSSLPVSSRANKKLRLSYSHDRRLNSTASAAPSTPTKKDQAFYLVDKIYLQHEAIIEDLQELSLIDDETPVNKLDLTGPVTEVIGHRDQESLERTVRLARQNFGESLPPDLLTEEELKLYKLLYGDPIEIASEAEIEASEEENNNNALLKDDGEGGWTEVDLPVESAESASSEQTLTEAEAAPEEETSIMDRARQVAESLGAQLGPEYPPEEDQPGVISRGHPLTREGRFGPDPSTVFLPDATIKRPITEILDRFPNKHLDEAATRVFGGEGLPDSVRTYKSPSKALSTSPVALSASESNMSPMEAALFMGAVFPGVYASATSALVEVRKRLGTQWIRGLIEKQGGPSILDAGGAGAGILAWRDIIKAEWSLMFPDRPEGSKVLYGKSTVLTGSEMLRKASSSLLENTTFLPRLPNYLHADSVDTSNNGGQRKIYDVIFAPHTLLDFEEGYERKNYVQNLWTMLNPIGGVLILMEKGHKAGFTAVGGAREMILDNLIFSPESSESNAFVEPPKGPNFPTKGKGMIIAPCTNHSTCPMYVDPNNADQKSKESCTFTQRYIRPAFLQRLLGQPRVNHEDVKFSYLAVQRGIDLRELREITQGPAATDAAFAGYEDQVETDGATEGTTVPTPKVDPLAFPRMILPPLKRKGHVTMDVCTPAGQLERWTVPRSFSKQAYRDARKSYHGDLWALGAKTRIHRAAKIELSPKQAMKKHKKTGDEPTKLEAALQAQDPDSEPVERDLSQPKPNPAHSSKRPPAWVKRLNVQRERRANKAPHVEREARKSKKAAELEEL